MRKLCSISAVGELKSTLWKSGKPPSGATSWYGTPGAQIVRRPALFRTTHEDESFLIDVQVLGTKWISRVALRCRRGGNLTKKSSAGWASILVFSFNGCENNFPRIHCDNIKPYHKNLMLGPRTNLVFRSHRSFYWWRHHASCLPVRNVMNWSQWS